ncbi:hypothetical protein [Pontixanthobacter gangjinensis]|uniref:Uncharacterized protein n=1 Tax=Pontixanthobacter gangjinensis TaxID=1028742 RepID=A0A6I4SJI7_9SPHN|nr:hypothetical protein [Pontixanthobacter gangjinensis]MXO55845.1 hypothetical protein [Pontixanthobacter gangjinensis]
MTAVQKALLLASAMIGIALLSIVGIVPERIAQWAPLALIAIFPSAWMGSNARKCGAGE